MQKNKFLAYLRMNWLVLLISTIFFSILSIVITAFYFGTTNFLALESFSRQQMTAYGGMYLFIGLMQAIFFVGLMQASQYYFTMGGGMAKLLGGDSSERAKPNVKWDEVIGLESAKRDAWELVRFLKDRKLLKTIGGNIIKGTLLVGPPGCGKTYLAKAIATECDLPLLSAVGSEFVGVIIGLGAARMKDLFKKARKLAAIEGGCLIFIDEIDSFARPRQEERGFGGATSHNATINQFLTEMDGLRQKENNIVIIAATNVPEEELDPAIMRSGRFDRRIYVEKPSTKDRLELLKFYLKKVKAEENLNLEFIAEKSMWFSASDIENLAREASIRAMRDKRDAITMPDLITAHEQVMGAIEKMGKNKILSSRVNVKWEDVIGMEQAKRDAQEIISLIKDHKQLQAVGGKIIKGTLMLGPPGCGKTYLAKAMATETGLPFISVAGAEFVGIFIGVGAQKIRDLFNEARALARAEGGCIIFIDEIDAFARHRMADRGFGGATDHNATVNQFLTELDGLRRQENNIIVLGATNAEEYELDPAIIRAGRLERKIYVGRPNLNERKDLFDYYLKKVTIDNSVNTEILARKTVWFSPSDIDQMIREAGLLALREKRTTITFKDLSSAYDKVLYGDKSNIILDEKEKTWTAYHEAGHAIIGYLLHPTHDVIKATIIPHKGFLGQVRPSPRREEYGHNKEWYLAQIKTFLASYAAEKIKFNSTSDGVGGSPNADFNVATQYAHAMVWHLGMGKSGMIGAFDNMMQHYGQDFLSEKTKEKLDEDIQDILQSCLKECFEILNKHRDLFEYFAQELLKKGELEYDEIEAIFKKFNLKPIYRV